MSFETTLNKAVEDFKAKFVGQHREAMAQEFETAQTMMLDAHKSLNEAERVMGLALTPMVVPVGVVETLAVPVEAVEVVEAVKVDRTKKVRLAARAFDRVRTGRGESVKLAKRAVLAQAILEAKANGATMLEINKACKRSNGWAHNFIAGTRSMGLI